MRAMILSLALGAMTLGGLAATPTTAKAADRDTVAVGWRGGRGWYGNSYYYPSYSYGYSGYYAPAYSGYYAPAYSGYYAPAYSSYYAPAYSSYSYSYTPAYSGYAVPSYGYYRPGVSFYRGW